MVLTDEDPVPKRELWEIFLINLFRCGSPPACTPCPAACLSC